MRGGGGAGRDRWRGLLASRRRTRPRVRDDVAAASSNGSSLGRSIIRDPAMFLMDEPLSNLDAHHRIEARSAILRLQRRLSTTTVFVTHDQAEAMTTGRPDHGDARRRVVQTGTPTRALRPSGRSVRRAVPRLAADERLRRNGLRDRSGLGARIGSSRSFASPVGRGCRGLGSDRRPDGRGRGSDPMRFAR